MNIRIDVIVNFIALSIFAYILSKTLLPALYEWFYEKVTGRPLKRDVDLDELIMKKKNMLQINSGINSPATKQITSKADASDIVSTLKTFAADPKHSEDVKKSLALFDSLQWGDSQELKECAKSIEREIGLKIQASELCSNLKEILQNKFLENFKERPLSFKTIISIVKIYSVINAIEKSMVPSIWTKELYSNDLDIKNALIIHLYYVKEKREEAYKLYSEVNQINDNTGVASSLAYLKCIQGLAPSYTLASLKEALIEHIFILKAIGHLPELNKNDRDSAFALLMLDSSASSEDIKRRYKKLAKTFHPDVLSGHGVPSTCIERASENFSKIKNAYEFLIK